MVAYTTKQIVKKKKLTMKRGFFAKYSHSIDKLVLKVWLNERGFERVMVGENETVEKETRI